MKVKTPVRGEIVESLQGRDKGCLYAVCEVLPNGFVSVADGVKKTLAQPKKKNVKHLKLLPANLADGGITYPWGKDFDTQTAHYIKVFKSAQADKGQIGGNQIV